MKRSWVLAGLTVMGVAGCSTSSDGTIAIAATASSHDVVDHQRPAAVPLVTCDPYFSIWSAADHLTDKATTHWTGKPQHLCSMMRVDGQTFRIMGPRPMDTPAAAQTRLIVLPTRTQYTFQAAGVDLTLEFMTPLLPDDLLICSRPVTYLTWTARAIDGKSHDVSVYFDSTAEPAVNVPEEQVTEEQGHAGKLTTLKVGTVNQPVLETSGDDQRINWGYFYVVSPEKDATLAPGHDVRDQFAKDGKVSAMQEPATQTAGVPARDADVLAISLPMGTVNGTAKSVHAMVAYDDLYSIRYFNEDLKAYWHKTGMSFTDLLQKADADYESLEQRCEKFDHELIGDLQKLGGDSYQQLGVLAWRQALAAQKICEDANGQPLMFSKENFSNGCISTVDVLYPAAPQMLVFSPTMLKASLRPLMDYSSSPRWKNNSAPHDLGQYPLATGQVYGGGEDAQAMPVEECGNMLILLAALSKAEGNATFAEPYWNTLTTWVNYLKEKGLDPENQLCTDDFAGHIARNANLSIKAIMGIASYGMMADMLGKTSDAQASMQTARADAAKWMKLAEGDDHYLLAFGADDTWSQKYNLVWDRLLGFNVFPPSVAKNEMAFYRTKMNTYGLPLDSRKDYTKLDWELWTATMATKHEDFLAIVDACAKYTNETPDRVPMSDWYDTKTAKKSGFQARSVVGGLFIPFIANTELWKKYESRDKTAPSGWAKTDFRNPELKPVVATAANSPAEWRFTTNQPDGKWMTSSFDDSSWTIGKSGFGTDETPGATINTKWDTDDIWLRRSVNIPADAFDRLKLMVHHDDDADIYINGIRAAHLSGFWKDYKPVKISAAARAAMHPGENVVAVHCHQDSGGQYIDVGFVDEVPAGSR